MEDRKKHILVFNRSFWPDTEATGQFLTELCEQLTKIYKVTVITGYSYYIKDKSCRTFNLYNKEIFNGIEILRVRHTRFWKASLMGRIINWFTYSVLAFLVALNIKPTLIIICTDPPFLGIIATILSRLKSIPFIYNCRDLFPEVAWGLGRLSKSNFLSQIYDCFNKKAFQSAYSVVCLGQSMKDRLINKGIPEGRIRIIPDWVDTSVIRPVPKNDNPLIEKFGLRNKFIIMYSGNLGLSQDFNSILHALTMMKGPFSFSLVFIGEGAAKEGLKKKISSLGIKNVLFLPYQPQEMLSFSLSMADLHLIPLKKDMAGVVVPSKVYGIMAAARPYLAVSEKESEPVLWVKEFGCGLWVDPSNVKAIADTLQWALGHPQELEEMGRRGRCIAETKFNKDRMINQWFAILDIL